MSKAKCFARHAKLRVDHYISALCRDLRASPVELRTFRQLIAAVSSRCALHRVARFVGVHCPLIDALVHLARVHDRFIRRIDRWSGSFRSRHTLLRSLTSHLLARYRVPAFFASVWIGGRSQFEWRKRHWYLAHADGLPLRKLDIPVPLTRRMEHLVLHSPDHFSFEMAIRHAELSALGATPELTRWVTRTHLGNDLRHGAFWQTVLRFLVRFQRELDAGRVDEIIDFIHFVRHGAVNYQTAEDVCLVEPPQPDFAIKGRSLSSLLRLVNEWHLASGRFRAKNMRWHRSPQQPLVVHEQISDRPPVVWRLIELTNDTALRNEGHSMQHCVGSYVRSCLRGRCQIWSLRRHEPCKVPYSVATIEVDPQLGAVVEARSFRNRPISSKARRMVETWADREQLTVLL